MQHLWNRIDDLNMKEHTKYTLFLWLTALICSGGGLLLWVILRTWILRSPEWGICFFGYPLFFSWIFVFLYSGRHSFHDGKKTK